MYNGLRSRHVWDEKNFVEGLVGKPEGKSALRKCTRIPDNIKTGLKKQDGKP
jgi:hypothetical protein